MDATDKAEFDAAQAEYVSLLRSTVSGSAALDAIESATRSGAQKAWTIGGPVLKAGGEALIQVLANFAASSLQAELAKLSGGR